MLPHVLHHVGPLAGAALLAGATGRVLFAAIGFVAAIPFLRRLRRRFETWRAPAVALASYYDKLALMDQIASRYPGIRGRVFRRMTGYLVAHCRKGLDVP